MAVRRAAPIRPIEPNLRYAPSRPASSTRPLVEAVGKIFVNVHRDARCVHRQTAS